MGKHICCFISFFQFRKHTQRDIIVKIKYIWRLWVARPTTYDFLQRCNSGDKTKKNCVVFIHSTTSWCHSLIMHMHEETPLLGRKYIERVWVGPPTHNTSFSATQVGRDRFLCTGHQIHPTPMCIAATNLHFRQSAWQLQQHKIRQPIVFTHH